MKGLVLEVQSTQRVAVRQQAQSTSTADASNTQLAAKRTKYTDFQDSEDDSDHDNLSELDNYFSMPMPKGWFIYTYSQMSLITM